MSRFSNKSKKIFDLIWYNADIEGAKSLINELSDPLDISFAKLWTVFYYLEFKMYNLILDELILVNEIIRSNPNEFILFFLQTFYFNYYSGWNSPIISFDLAKKYFNESENDYMLINYAPN